MTERHYDDEALVTMLASGAETSDTHLSACGECTEKLDTFRCVTDALGDVATWDQRAVSEAPNQETIATLRAFADTMAAEDTAAEAFLAELLAQPRETWKATLAARPQHRTAGTVRRLLAATDRALDTMPADAVELTSLAVDIASTLDPSTHRPTTLATLRGQAWRERAYALFYTGQFAAAETAVDTAERHFAGCVVDEYELARLGIVRAVVERGLERYSDASRAALWSADRFVEFGDTGRMVSARLANVQQQFSVGDFENAYAALCDLEEHIRNTDRSHTHAIVLGNLGYCSSKLGRPAAAIQFHETAALLLSDLGMETEVVRVRWNIAAILASAGKLEEALRRYEVLHGEFDRLGMAGPACDVALEMAELLIDRKRYADAEVLCRAAMSYVEGAGLAHTARALTALALIHEAVSNRTAVRETVTKVREYLRRLPEQPALLFAEAPV
ncbi:MAG TPA: hypothetical protein VEU30_04180 [Thermoanaerobaculia bacterium]|nr:hypothetical protein [Thermoanaerobaculia bacterium]